MEKLHNHLLETSAFYRGWHNHKASPFFHWYVFLIVTSFVTLSLLGNIDQYNKENLAAVGGAGQQQIERVLVKFKSNASFEKRSIAIARHGLKEVGELKQIGVKMFNVPPGKAAREVATEINYLDRDLIEYAEADVPVPADNIPNDPYFVSQGDKVMMNLPAAWDLATGNSNVIVAILDTGVDCNHEDLAPLCIAGWNVVNNSSDTSDYYFHGTASAGVAAAAGNNGVGLAGGVWLSKIMPMRMAQPLSGCGDACAYGSDMAEAINWAADHGAKVISMSYATKNNRSVVNSAATYAKGKGALVFSSSGNTGAPSGFSDTPDLTIVGGASTPDSWEGYSTYGDDVDISAPSCSSVTTWIGGGYGGFCGTSNSTPEVAGVVALIRSANPTLTPTQVLNTLYSTAHDAGTPGRDQFFGWGFVDAAAAVVAANGSPTPPPPVAPVAPSLSASTASTCGGYVNTSWTSVSGATSYKLYRNGSLINSSATSPYVDGGLSTGSTYTYTVRATNSTGDSPDSNSASAAASSVCPPPAQTLSILNQTSSKTANSITISWQTSLPSTGTVVYGKTSSLLSSTINSSSTGTSHSVTITGLTKSTRYYYKIIANSTDPLLTTSTGTLQVRTAQK